jgi:nucleotide-binding universal stress UspA family protein
MRAVKHAIEFAKDQVGTEVHVLNVQEPIAMKEVVFRDRLSDIRELEQHRVQAGKVFLEPACVLLGDAGVPHTAHVSIGEPGPAIADHAKKYHCGLIIMGTRGTGSVAKLFLGSVATKVIHLVEVPVTLVK